MATPIETVVCGSINLLLFMHFHGVLVSASAKREDLVRKSGGWETGIEGEADGL
jgi:hypothetical protein